MKDPKITGIGLNTYKTAAECESTYFFPLSTGDQYDGLYLQVAEPPAEMSDANVNIEEPREDIANLEFIGVIINDPQEPPAPPPPGGCTTFCVDCPHCDCISSVEEMIALGGAIDTGYGLEFIKCVCPPDCFCKMPYEEPQKESWRDIVDPNLLSDPEVIEAFDKMEMGEPLLVRRLDDASQDYYLAPFGKVKEKRKEFTATGVIILDAEEGYFKEASWTKEAEKFPNISKEKAVDIAVKYFLRITKRQPIEYLTVQLVWEPNGLSPSPYKPYWEININDYTFYVTQEGELF
jgi:hypothetical protein